MPAVERPTPAHPEDPTAGAERPGIFGLETEYLVFFVGDDPDAEPPPFDVIESTVWCALLDARKAVRSSGAKRGYFLENGGLVHFEVYLRHQEDTPILEASTPECRSAHDLLVWSRAFDRLLLELSRRSATILFERGWPGYIAFGKNNRDARGVGFGCHENYLVYHRMPARHRLLILLSAPWILLSLLPALVAYAVVLFIVLFTLALGHASSRLRTFGRGFYLWLRGRETLWRNLVGTFFIFTNVLVVPATWIYRRVLRIAAYPELIGGLTPFVATRQIWAGAGALDFQRGVYALAQRPELLSTLADIVIFGRRKTVFDLKGFLYRPISLFVDEKKLVITAGDSNLSDLPVLLKIGATALVIEMIEEGERFDDLALARPLRAFRSISRGGPWKDVELESGERLPAIEVQRRYLERAERFFGERPATARTREILREWRRVLETFAEEPAKLSSMLDWAAKKAILDRLVLQKTTWSVFFAWGGLFERAGFARVVESPTLAFLSEKLGIRRGAELTKALERLGLERAGYALHRDLWLRARKIDLRYHELNPLGGYQRNLEASGAIERLTVDEEIERATRVAPNDTRARVRAHYVRQAAHEDAVHANWHEVEEQSPYRRISLADPFAFWIPGEDRGRGGALGRADPEPA